MNVPGELSQRNPHAKLFFQKLRIRVQEVIRTLIRLMNQRILHVDDLIEPGAEKILPPVSLRSRGRIESLANAVSRARESQIKFARNPATKPGFLANPATAKCPFQIPNQRLGNSSRTTKFVGWAEFFAKLILVGNGLRGFVLLYPRAESSNARVSNSRGGTTRALIFAHGSAGAEESATAGSNGRPHPRSVEPVAAPRMVSKLVRCNAARLSAMALLKRSSTSPKAASSSSSIAPSS